MKNMRKAISLKKISSRVVCAPNFARALRSKRIESERKIRRSLTAKQNAFDPFSHWYKPQTTNQKINMSVNTAPIKYAQRSDSIYLTIALPGKAFLIYRQVVFGKKVTEMFSYCRPFFVVPYP